MTAALALGTLLAMPMVVAGLIPIVMLRWLIEGWPPVTARDEPYDFATETIAGIPVEELGLPPSDPLY